LRAVISNAETGYYIFWLEPGTRMFRVSSKDHPTQVSEVEIIAQQGVNRDYALLFGGRELFLPWITK
jgi:hypothetical protein